MALLYFPHQRVEISFLVRRQPQTQILSGTLEIELVDIHVSLWSIHQFPLHKQVHLNCGHF